MTSGQCKENNAVAKWGEKQYEVSSKSLLQHQSSWDRHQNNSVVILSLELKTKYYHWTQSPSTSTWSGFQSINSQWAFNFPVKLFLIQKTQCNPLASVLTCKRELTLYRLKSVLQHCTMFVKIMCIILCLYNRRWLAPSRATLSHLAFPWCALFHCIHHASMRHFPGSLHCHQETHPTQSIQIQSQSDVEDCTGVAHIHL